MCSENESSDTRCFVCNRREGIVKAEAGYGFYPESKFKGVELIGSDDELPFHEVSRCSGKICRICIVKERVLLILRYALSPLLLCSGLLIAGLHTISGILFAISLMLIVLILRNKIKTQRIAENKFLEFCRSGNNKAFDNSNKGYTFHSVRE